MVKSIVKDRLKYNDPKDKRKGYEALTGKKSKDVYLESVVGRPKKNDISKTHMSSLFNSDGFSQIAWLIYIRAFQ